MEGLQVFEYNGSPIQFEIINGQVMANATLMCKHFGKQPKDFLKTKQTKRYLQAISTRIKILPTDLQQVRNGGNDAGTWLHERIVLKLAQWLDVDFEIWCDEKIAELLRTGKIEIKKAHPLELAKNTILVLTEEIVDLKAKGMYECEARHQEEKRRKRSEKESASLKWELEKVKKDLHWYEDKEDLQQLYRR